VVISDWWRCGTHITERFDVSDYPFDNFSGCCEEAMVMVRDESDWGSHQVPQ
jgi:hypothetical protein